MNDHEAMLIIDIEEECEYKATHIWNTLHEQIDYHAKEVQELFNLPDHYLIRTREEGLQTIHEYIELCLRRQV